MVYSHTYPMKLQWKEIGSNRYTRLNENGYVFGYNFKLLIRYGDIVHPLRLTSGINLML